MGEEGLISDNLKEGTRVTIFYTETERNRLANRIEGAAAVSGH